MRNQETEVFKHPCSLHNEAGRWPANEKTGITGALPRVGMSQAVGLKANVIVSSEVLES